MRDLVLLGFTGLPHTVLDIVKTPALSNWISKPRPYGKPAWVLFVFGIIFHGRTINIHFNSLKQINTNSVGETQTHNFWFLRTHSVHDL